MEWKFELGAEVRHYSEPQANADGVETAGDSGVRYFVRARSVSESDCGIWQDYFCRPVKADGEMQKGVWLQAKELVKVTA